MDDENKLRALIEERWRVRRPDAAAGVGEEEKERRSAAGDAAEAAAEAARSEALVSGLLAAATQQADRLAKALGDFAERLRSLEESSRAVGEDTQKLKNVHANIDAAMASVGKILDMFSVASKLEARVRKGPSLSTLAEYFASMDQLAEAEAYLQEHRNFASAPDALAQLAEVRAVAVAGCEQFFVALLRKTSVPFDPAKTPVADAVDPRIVGEMKRVAMKLIASKSKAYAEDYASHRAKFLLGSLAKLSPEKSSLAFLANPVKFATYTRGSHPVIGFLKKAHELVKRERDLAEDILAAHAIEAWPGTAQPPLRFVAETIESSVKALRNGGGTFGMLVATDVFSELEQILPEYDAATVLHPKRAQANTLIADLVETERRIEAGILKWFAEFEEGLLSETIDTSSGLPALSTGATSHLPHAVTASGQSAAKRGVPPDGTVHEITAFTISFFKRASEYKGVIDEFMTKLSLTQKVPHSSAIKGVSGTGNWILRCLASLQSSLESKAKREKSVALAGIFLVNNFNYIAKGIKTMEEALGEGLRPTLAKFEGLVESQKGVLVSTWRRALEAATLDDPAEKNITRKSYVKHKFKTFNKEIEELFDAQKRFSVPDVALREELRNAIAGPLVTQYARCVSRYQDVPFSRNRGKYIRYSPETLRAMLGSLFEGFNSAAIATSSIGTS